MKSADLQHLVPGDTVYHKPTNASYIVQVSNLDEKPVVVSRTVLIKRPEEWKLIAKARCCKPARKI